MEVVPATCKRANHPIDECCRSIIMRHVIWSVVILLLSMTPAIAQQELRSSTKGASTPLPIIGSSIDADHNS